ncbi:T9SS type B sorting domain-containing protein [Flavobacterium sp. GP15]|uniref:T9SS type B sorting domain-containing protein n=1 Tax=Flavobacterium sp. GP15 TaxID=2758567 RepID=UPI001CB75198|nr:T9SS type B sorting domain-containing protein [Flavobacterium sp. GP15]
MFTIIFLQSFLSYSQNIVSYVSKHEKDVAKDIFQIGKVNFFSKNFENSKEEINATLPPDPSINPVIKYAQLPYSGQVSECPNDGRLLPKLFLCGGNDSRMIETGIIDAKSIIWERFISGGSCSTVSNTDCANLTASQSCWVKVSTGMDFLANAAGQFRVTILDKNSTPYTHYFNVYQNTLIPTATTKSDIVNYGSSCKIAGKITVGGFGNGYEYSFTTTGSPGTWQDSNVFITSTPGNYTAFIRIKGVIGSCEFKVINLDIKNVNFSVVTEIISPKCSGALGSIRVISSDVKQQYKYKITKPGFTATSNLTGDSEYIFTGLASGSYNLETTVEGSNCMIDSKTVNIVDAPNVIKASARISNDLTACNDTGIILVENLSGGTTPYTYSVSIDGAAFVNNGTNKSIITSKSGIYTIRVTDANGCFIDTKVTVPVVDKPIYTVTKSDGSCSSPNGTIKVTIIDAKGYNVNARINGETYNIVNGYIEYPNRAPENYIISVQYRKGNNGNYCIDPDIPISIGLTTALTASAGVAELSGCGPAGNELQGKVRITNAEGGVPILAPNPGPYLYSYDNQSTWTTSKEGFINPGKNIILYIKDANCIVALDPITLGEKPLAPTIKVDSPSFNCDGTATTTVTAIKNGTESFSYEYYLDGVLNTNSPTNVFKNVSQGDHTVTVSYNVLSVPTESVLLRETFGSGPDVSSPGINAAFCWERQVEATKCNGNKLFGNGEYTVTNSLKNNPYSGWHNPIDHTSGGKDPNGRYLAVDAGSAIPNNAVLYRKTIKDIIPNQPVKVTFVGTNLLKIGNNQPDASLTVELQDANGVALDSKSTGGIPKTNGWVEYTRIINPGNNTTLDFVLRLEISQVDGIDFAVDDLVVTQMPKACNTVAAFPLVVDGSKAFSAGITGYKDVQCNGETNGEITLSAKNFDPIKGFQYQVGTGSWQTVIPGGGATSGSKTLTSLPSGIYMIKIRYDNTASSCTFPVSQEIKNPAVLKIKADVTTKATCLFGATITAEASGGTPGYKYELRKEDGTTIVQPFQTSGEFTNVLVGKYTVVAKDLNSCQSAVLAKVEVVAAVPPTALFEPSNLCFDSTAEIKIKITGGVSPYTYTTIYNGGTKSNSSATFNGPILTYNVTNAGTYEFEITDSYGCKTNVLTQTISAKLVTVTPVTTPLSCKPAPANQAVITGTITGGKAPFTVTLTAGSNTGSLVQPTAVTTTNERKFTYTTAVSGNYKFKITDANNCTTTSEATIAALNPLTLGFNNVNPKCNGASNGSVSLIPDGGSGVYTYSKDGVLYDNTILYTGLKAGIEYTFYVKDSNKCITTLKVNLVDPSVVIASASIPLQTCGNSTIVTASGSGGAGLVTTDYTYSFKGGGYNTSNTYTATKTAIGYDLNYSVKDANGCTKDGIITIPAYNPPTGITFSTPAAISCQPGFTTTSITLTPVVVSGTGVAPFTYKIISGPGTATLNVTGLNSGTFTGLVSGDYTFEIKDANGCTKQASTAIAPAATIAVSGAKTDVKCVGNTDGTATFTVTGASSSGNFTHTISPIVPVGQISVVGDVVSVTGLSAGIYKLTVTDKATGCTSNTASVTVGAATAITITGVTATNVNCGQSTSTIVVTASGGKLNYKYAYVIAGSGMPAANLFDINNTTINTGVTQSNLSWDVYIMDQNDCTAGPFTFPIFRDASPSVKSPAPATICFKAGTPTAIDVRTFFNLGTGAHTYTVNTTELGLGVTNYNITADGTYTVIAKDAKGCTATATYEVKPELTITATRVKDLTCDNDAEISFVASGGTTVYSTYEVQLNGTGTWTTVTSPFIVTAYGIYKIRVTDNANPSCAAISNPITITPNTIPGFSHNETQVSCNGGSNGVINITNPTGIPPFTYLITKGATTFSTATATGLQAGIYNVLIKDGKGCPHSEDITISEPTKLATTASVTTKLSCGTNNATQDAIITVVPPTTGTGPYKYSFNGGAFDVVNTYSTSVSGDVTVQVQDKNLCTLATALTVTVAGLNSPKLDPITGITGTTIYCTPVVNKTSTVTVTATAGTGVGTLTYTMVSGPTTGNTTANPGEFTDLTTGNYVFKVTDANGCSVSGSYFVKPLVSITASLTSQVNVACKGDSTGSAQISVSGFGTGTYTATLTIGTGAVPVGSISTNTVDVTGLAAGAYTLKLTDDITGCTADVIFTITESNLTLALTSNKNANCKQPLSKVTVTGGGGKGPYSYAYITSPSPAKPAAGDYVLNKTSADLDPATPTWYAWVKDANGCETSLPITIAKDKDLAINLPALQCFVGTAFNITLSVDPLKPGTGALTYSVNGVTIPNDVVAGLPVNTATYSITAAGTYKLEVKDANNCLSTVDYIVNKQIFAAATPDKDLTCSAPVAASITVKMTNGTAPFTYQMYDGNTAVGAIANAPTSTFTVNTITTAGNYKFVVTDANGCSVTTNVLPVIVPVNPVIISVTVPLGKEITCNGAATASIDIVIDNTKGQGPYVFNVKQYTDVTYSAVLKDFTTQTSGLPAGFFEVTVTDAKGCTDTMPIKINEPNPIDVQYTPTNITCDLGGSGKTKGRIEVTSITGGTTTLTDKYNVYVSNDSGYYEERLNVSPTSTLNSEIFDIIDFGLYQIVVTDVNGCPWIEKDIIIAQPPGGLGLTVSATPPVCGSLGSAEVKVNTTFPGALPFHFSIYQPGSQYTAPQVGVWYDEDAPNSLKTTIPNLIPGVTYTFIVYDENTKCYYYETFVNTVPSSSTLTTTATPVPITCKGSADGSVNLRIESVYTVPVNVSYEIFNAGTLVSTGIIDSGTVPAQITSPSVINGVLNVTSLGAKPTYAGLAYGTYYVLIKETSGPNAGCTVTTVPFSITQSAIALSLPAPTTKNSNTCVANAGIITAIARDGTATITNPYLYQIFPDDLNDGIISGTDPDPLNATFSASFTVAMTANTFAKDKGDYIVYVKDAYGCIQYAFVTLVDDLPPAITAQTPPCFVAGMNIPLDFSTFSSSTIGTPTYSINGTRFQPSPNFTISAAGTYSLEIKDGNNCIARTPYVVKEELTLSPTVITPLDCKTVAPNGAITVVADGGDNTAYAYTITAGTTINTSGATSGVFTNLAAGTYSFLVSDGNCTATTTAKIDALVPIVPTKKVATPACIGNSANVEINATGGTEIFEYKKGALGTYSTTNIFSQTALEGTVAYYVRDSKGCEETIDVLVTDPTPITVSNIATVQMLCGGGNLPTDATITVTAAGGTGTLEYSFDNGAHYSTNNVLTTKISGSYTIIVKDANGCTSVVAAIPETIAALDPPVITTFDSTPMTCPGLVSDVTINHTHGIGTLTYTLVSGPALALPNTTGDLSGIYLGLIAGDYVFRITDGNGCTDEEFFNVPVLPKLKLAEQVVANVNCKGGATGSATFTASDFAVPANYSWSVTASPAGWVSSSSKTLDVITLSNLIAGTYAVKITDNTTLCDITKSVIITEPAADLSITATASNVNCNDALSVFTMVPVGGTANYEYAFVEGGTAIPPTVFSGNTTLDTATLGNAVTVGALTTWSVDVYVKDANDCTAMVNVSVSKDVAPTISVPAQQCFTGTDLTVDLNGLTTAHNATKFYTVDGVDLATSTAIFTAPGTYKLGIRDDNGCEAFVSYTVQKQLLIKVELTKDLYCASPIDATIKVDIKDGVGTYSTQLYSGIAPGGTAVGVPYTTASFTANVSLAGDYYFVTRDSNSPACTVTSDKVTVTDPVKPVIDSTPITSAIQCTGGTATMQVILDPLTGVGPYTYTVTRTLPTAGTPEVQVSNNIFTGLIAGTYDVVVTDAIGCISATFQTVIVEPVQLIATIVPFAIKTNCDTATTVKVIASGGTLPYYYDFGKGYDTVDNITVNNINGTIQTINYTVKDGNGCETAMQSVNVNPLNKPTDLAFDATPIYCLPAANQTSTVDVKATNGVGGLSFQIIATNTATAPTLFGPISVPDSSIAARFSGLLPGDYTFKVTDANGCSYQELTTVDDGIKIAVSGEVVGVACKGEVNGKITFKVSDFGATGFIHSYTGPTGGTETLVGTDTIELTNLIAGTYGIKVVDNTTQCEATVSIEVKEPAVLDVNYVTIKNANCNRGFEIKATAFDGTPGYTYAFVKAGDTKVYDVYDTAILDPAFPWTLWAKDDHGCEVSMPIMIVKDPMPVITKAEPTQCPSTTGTYDITVSATGFTTDLEYSLDGNTWQLNNNILTVQTTGNHTVYVRDANKCVVTETVTILEPLQLLFDLTTTPTCINADGVVTLTASGGTIVPSYEYSIDGTNYVVSNVFSNLAPKATPYTFYVKDLGTLCIKSVDVLIENPTQVIDFALAKTDVICNGESNGIITVNMVTPTTTVNNNPVYTYSINPSPLGMLLKNNVFSNLPADTYTVTVTSGRGCFVDKVIIVDKPAPIVVAAPTVSEYGCTTGNGTNDATITVAATGGSSTYTIYEFLRDGNPIPVQRVDNPIYTETDLLGGNYVINVYDNNGCIGTTTATINPFIGLDEIDVIVDTPITCITYTEDITVTASTIGGVPANVTILVEDVITNTSTNPPTSIYGTVYTNSQTVTTSSASFTGLPVGSYRITVTNPTTGCSIKTIHYVNEPNTFSIVASNVKNVTCYGSLTGSIDLTMVDDQPNPGNAGAFSYTITGPKPSSGTTSGVTLNLFDLPAGVYNVKAKLVNTPSCEVETNFTIAGPTAELEIFSTATPITCDPGNDGTISVSADGGWGIYQYELVGPVSVLYSDQFYFENLTPGTYTVNVKDLYGCIKTATVTLKIPDQIVFTASATATTLLCNGGNDGEIVVGLPTGGQGTNYSYILNYVSANPVFSTAPQTSNVFSGLNAGTYTVSVVDGLNCVSQPTLDIVIGEPTKVEASLTLATGITCEDDATLTLSATGGTGPYEYSVDPNFATIEGGFLSTITFAVGLGDHQYYVRDSKNCVSFISNNITVNALTPLDLNLDLSNAVIYCKNDASGTIDASGVGGLGDYKYTLLSGDGLGTVIRPIQSDGYFDNLPPGSYIVRVTSGDCKFETPNKILIKEPDTKLIASAVGSDITCNGSDNGKIVITASGGTGKIKYAISPNLSQFDDQFIFDRLAPGTYTVLVQDENGCIGDGPIDITIKEPLELLSDIAGSIKEEFCAGDKDGAFSIDIEGGTLPYSVSLDDRNGTYTTGSLTQTFFDFKELAGGDHTVYIRDANGCTTTVTAPLKESVTMNPKAVVQYYCVNNAAANTVTITIDDSITDPSEVDYAIDGGTFQSSSIFTNVAPGFHTVIARNLNGCEQPTVNFEVIQVNPLTLVLNDGGLNEIVAVATGGGGNYTYTFNGENYGSTSSFIIYKSGDYTVTVTDANGCTATATRYFTYIDVCIPNNFTPNGDNINDTWAPGCTVNYKDLVFSIFDRYGRKIGTYRVGQEWDGKYNGEELPSGDYWYILKLNDKKDDREFVGHFTLYR